MAERDQQKMDKKITLVMSEEDYYKAVLTTNDELKNMKERIAKTASKESLVLGIMIGMFTMAVIFAILSN